MEVSFNLRDVKAMLLHKSLYDFIKEMWDAYETDKFIDHWLIEFQCECFMYSVKHFLPSYIWADWISDEEYEDIKTKNNAVCPVRDKMYNGKHVHNHDWNMPPRHMKSSIMNVCGPVWLAINCPIKVASVSHTRGLSDEMNIKRQKLFESDKFKYYFGDDKNCQLSNSTATSIRLKNGSQLYSVCQASFTGFGADCFVAGTKIKTIKGEKNIEDIVAGDKVLTFNTETNSLEINEVEHTRRIEKDELIRITTSGNRKLESTTDHRYWVVNKGYVPACELEEGDKFITISKYKEFLQMLWRVYQGYKRDMQKVYVKDIQLSDKDAMRKLSEIIYDFFIRVDKKLYKEGKLSTPLLFKSMFLQNKQPKENERNICKLSTMWKEISIQWSSLLWGCLFEESTTDESRTNIFKNEKDLFSLWERILSSTLQYLLQSKLCKYRSFNKDVIKGKLELEEWKKLSNRILRDLRLYKKSRQPSMSDMQCGRNCKTLSKKWGTTNKNKFDSTSQGRKYIQQFCREFNNLMYKMSWEVTSSEEVVKIKKYKKREYVYDIQVANNHNFFANDVLVHNCIIADDLISSVNAQKDGAVLANAVNFFRKTLPTRLNSKVTGVIWQIQQRLGMGDISGTILKDKRLLQLYSHTELHAEAQKDITLIYPCTGKIKVIKKGDFLWEERFGDYTGIKLEVGNSEFETQYNQNPSNSDLNIIKDYMIHYVDDDEFENFKNNCEFHYASHDCAVWDKKTSDFHGYSEGYADLNSLIVCGAKEERLGYIKEKQLMQDLKLVYPEILQIVENKANGSPLLQDLKRDVAGLIEFNPGDRDKGARLELASRYLDSGAVRFVKNEQTDYLIQRLKEYPLVEHDDIIDAFSQMVIYHFVMRQVGIYTQCFTYKNVIEDIKRESNQPVFYEFAANINADKIRVIAVNHDLMNDEFIVEKEWEFKNIEDFENFCKNEAKYGNLFIDASIQNRLKSIILSNMVYLTAFEDADKDTSINLMRAGFYKNKIKVCKSCLGTRTDIARLRFTSDSVSEGVNRVASLDEGYAGCLRALITYDKGLNSVWY